MMDAIRRLVKNRQFLCEHCSGFLFTSELAGGERSSRWGRNRRRLSQGNVEVADEEPTANNIPSSPDYIPADVYHYKYFVDDCHIGDIYLDVKGPVAFHCFRRDEWTPWHGEWNPESDHRALKIAFDPDATYEGARAYTWTYVGRSDINRTFMEPQCGIDSYGRAVRMESRYEWIRLFDGSYYRLHRDFDSIYF